MSDTICPENYIVIQGWMITELGLSGRELILYALIFGFSQGDGEGYSGSLRYLTEWSGSSRRNVMTVLSSLVNKGFLIKHEETRGGVKVCRYVTNFTTSEKISPPPSEIISQGGEKISPNTYMDNMGDIKESKAYSSTSRVDGEVIIEDSPNDRLSKAIEGFKDYRKQIKSPLTLYAERILRSKLEKLAPGDIETQIAIIDQSIVNGWKGIFPLGGDRGNGNSRYMTKGEQARKDLQDGYRMIAEWAERKEQEESDEQGIWGTG